MTDYPNMCAVIPTFNRPQLLVKLVEQLLNQGVHDIMIINNGDAFDDETYRYLEMHPCIRLRTDDDRTPHIYEQWNYGIKWQLNSWYRSQYVAILNDDVMIPDNFVVRMCEVLDKSGATVAFPNQHGHQMDMHFQHHGAIDLTHRTTGYCFVVNHESHLLFDENFKWWYGDDDFDWRARSHGNGTYLIQDVTVQHLHPSESTNNSPELTAQAGRDRETFIRKHGKAPW